jgi:bifunctional DNA-binding transcriptional regulator/antitoxin component of YhaV-PrlF toxin-antitoxin module
MTTVLSSKGQLVLPAELRREDDVRPGERFAIERLGRGEYRLTRVAPRRNAGLVNLLLACPAKGLFQPLDRSETTDDIWGARRR